MFETTLYKYDFEQVPEAVSIFKKMEVKHEALTLIVPQFEAPLFGNCSLIKDWLQEFSLQFFGNLQIHPCNFSTWMKNSLKRR